MSLHPHASIQSIHPLNQTTLLQSNLQRTPVGTQISFLATFSSAAAGASYFRPRFDCPVAGSPALASRRRHYRPPARVLARRVLVSYFILRTRPANLTMPYRLPYAGESPTASCTGSSSGGMTCASAGNKDGTHLTRWSRRQIVPGSKKRRLLHSPHSSGPKSAPDSRSVCGSCLSRVARCGGPVFSNQQLQGRRLPRPAEGVASLSKKRAWKHVSGWAF